MKIQDIFEKPVDRHIDGVIKADDERNLLKEIEEYVITDEVRKALNKLLDHYLNNRVVNGAWISGFFGSGKSHLLKMLALLFENRIVDGHSTTDLFLPKITDDALFKASLDKASKIPSKSILFNIAQKANIVNKSNSDTLLGTFIKVFDEMCSYSGKQGYIAQFERDLDDRELLTAFEEAYKSIANKDWKEGRDYPIFEADNISKAYAQATDSSVQDSKNILEKYRTHYQMSIEEFAIMVNKYIEKQGKNFRLNFFVDEVGQYIANNVRLMTDLQTIAESLATKCFGRAWIFVTSQQDMDAILGEMTKQEGNDFSKIQGRFKCKVSLSSANVDEVIRLRLLAKNNQGMDVLDSLYGKQQNNLKTLFDFPDGSKKYKNFKDRQHFVGTYPFIPYQFPLFQAAMQNLSKHDAFTGQYLSVGERSMLEVFQDVVKHIASEDIGQLATFNLMFEGIREVIKSTVLWGVTQSEQHMKDDEFTQNVLKILFLVKYVKEFQATPRNLAVLLIERFDQDLVALGKRVEESLNILEQQTYIRRNDDLYEYLTDKERDIEDEIKNQEFDQKVLNEQINNMFFTFALNLNKIRYEVNGQDFPFTKRLDSQVYYGKEHELGINIVTENQNEDMIRPLSITRDDLVIQVPEDDLFYKDNQVYLKTETYVRQNSSNGNSAEVRAIVTNKVHQNQARFERIKRRASELLGNAKMFVAGDDVHTEISEPKTRISFGFQKLIENAYSNLQMLGETHYNEKDIAQNIENGKQVLNDLQLPMTPTEAEREILSFLEINRDNAIKTTLASVVERFERKPYGWSIAAILCLTARLYGAAKVEVILDSKILDDDQLVEKTIRNSANHAKVILRPMLDIKPKMIKRLKEVYSNVFHKPVSVNEAKALANEFNEAVTAKYSELQGHMKDIDAFPFLDQLKPAVELLFKLQNKSYDWYYSNLGNFENELLDIFEHTVDPILAFLISSRKDIYEHARKFLEEQEHNLIYVEGDDEKEKIKDIIADENCFRGNNMNILKELVDILDGKVKRRLKASIEEKGKQLEEYQKKLENIGEYANVSQERLVELNSKLATTNYKLQSATQISVLNDLFSNFEKYEYPDLAKMVKQWGEVKEPELSSISGKPTAEDVKPSTKKEFVIISEVKLSYNKPLLESQTDVEEYVQAFKIALLAELEKGNSLLL